MPQTMIEVENLSKLYELGTIGGRTLRESLERQWYRLRGKEHELQKVGARRQTMEPGHPQAGPRPNTMWALKDVSFTVKEGEVLGIIGRNGAGKSTLLKLLTRITEPTSGRALVYGRVASLLEVGTGFHPELTGRENIYLNGAVLGMKRAEVAHKFDEIVAFSEVEQFIDTPVKRYSSGMYVRLAFAVAAHLDPEILLVYGDTNSTLAGALAAAKLHLCVAHVEAGLRSYNREMPEELNRVIADHLSALLFCPSENAAANLAKEGITSGVHVVGDVMADALAAARERASDRADVLKRLGVKRRGYCLATIHRAENTDDRKRLSDILAVLGSLGEPVVFPMHPRARAAIGRFGLAMPPPPVQVIEPLGYLDAVALESNARLILTDSGGMQKEAYWLGVPCVTLRDETEWVETVKAGWNTIAGADKVRIAEAVRTSSAPTSRPPLYGDADAAHRCVAALAEPTS